MKTASRKGVTPKAARRPSAKRASSVAKGVTPKPLGISVVWVSNGIMIVLIGAGAFYLYETTAWFLQGLLIGLFKLTLIVGAVVFFLRWCGSSRSRTKS